MSAPAKSSWVKSSWAEGAYLPGKCFSARQKGAVFVVTANPSPPLKFAKEKAKLRAGVQAFFSANRPKLKMGVSGEMGRLNSFANQPCFPAFFQVFKEKSVLMILSVKD
jgi:hypothetical protein